MDLSLKTVETTGMETSMGALQKHESTDVLHIARTLITKWRDVVNEWINNANMTCVDQLQDQEEEEEEQMVFMKMIRIKKKSTKKLEASKRKLQQRYEEAQKEKRLRKIQVMERRQPSKQQGLIVPKTKRPITLKQNRNWGNLF
ncbi:hypothetical protein L6452_27158 [Arctium lappa]|uniref:Uncharacterized protein n=1 Tax=Arctium lappa TaxID=4217 RepID=A0ACB8ZWR5_ARCLA|nr:hypothetical protein L6452_27158 [Arctium lappa]